MATTTIRPEVALGESEAQNAALRNRNLLLAQALADLRAENEALKAQLKAQDEEGAA